MFVAKLNDMKTLLEFNLNDTIWVKLYDPGYETLAAQHNILADFFPALERRTAEHYKKKANEDGYTQFQMWYFMECFGNALGGGVCRQFSLNILIDPNSLKPAQ